MLHCPMNTPLYHESECIGGWTAVCSVQEQYIPAWSLPVQADWIAAVKLEMKPLFLQKHSAFVSGQPDEEAELRAAFC